jgi:three-Cys-motif partner protein
MARKPKQVRWKRDGHTEAKHQILVGYLDAWIPILARQDDHLIFIDAFAGPGRYADGEKGSPLLMIDAYLRRGDRQALGVTAHFFFIEGDSDRAAALRDELSKREQPNDAEWRVIEGDYATEFPALLDEIDRRWPNRRPPVFAFIDPFGAEQNKLDLASRLLGLPRCELLMFVPIGHFARFVGERDLERTLDSLYGTGDWRGARQHGDVATRKAILVELLRQQLGESCDWVRAFEIVPRHGGSSHFLFFGSNNKKGLARMKTAMWKADPTGGQRYKDSTTADHPVLFEPEPNLTPLLDALKVHFGTREFTIEEAEDFTLCETPFLHDAHLKRKVLAPAERAGELDVVKAKQGRRRSFYPPATVMRFT